MRQGIVTREEAGVMLSDCSRHKVFPVCRAGPWFTLLGVLAYVNEFTREGCYSPLAQDHYPPDLTPEGFWELSFADSIEERGRCAEGEMDAQTSADQPARSHAVRGAGGG